MSGQSATTPEGSLPLHAGYDEAVTYLEGLRVSEIEPGLDRIGWLCDKLGHPERRAPIVHVTGTNGKGSTSRLIAAVLSKTGRRTGLYTSPHLERLVERIVVDQTPIPEETFAALTAQVAAIVAAAADEIPRPPTHFETLTGIGFQAMADAEIEALVLEVGLGGRWDATNVADGAVAVITNVALDHTEFLGSTREEIAFDKAGVIKPGAIAVIGETDPSVRAVFEQRCIEVGATPWRLGEEFSLDANAASDRGRTISVTTPRAHYRDLVVPFHGLHQAHNAAVALAALDAFLDEPSAQELVEAAWRSVPNPGRFEIIETVPPVVIDVAHNPHGMAALVATLDELFPGRQRVVVIGINPHKDAEPMLGTLLEHTRAIVTTQVLDAPAIPAQQLAKSAEAVGFSVVKAVPDAVSAIDEAFALAGPDDVVVATGSHYWIGLVRAGLLGRAGTR